MTLKDKKCIPCEGNTKPLSSQVAEAFLAELDHWRLIDDTEIITEPDSTLGKRIRKDFECKDFKEALGFINEIGDVAEYEGHHPDLDLHNWNKITITLSTHAIRGLSENDFIMAAKIDQIRKEMVE